MTIPFRHAICNEIYQDFPFHEACKSIRRIGYTGIEIAPFTLSPTPAALTLEERRQFRGIISSEGLIFVGLHWLMMAPPGLHATTPDRATRERSWQHVRDMIDLCADLGDHGVVVFGSPKQRAAAAGDTIEEATKRFAEGFAGVASHALERGVTVLIEPLPSNQCNVVQTVEEAVRIVREIDTPSIRTMFDVHNALDESEPDEVIVDRWFDYIRHVHLNERSGDHLGAGDYDFKPLLATLRRRNYRGWLSLEAFDFEAGAERMAAESFAHIQSEIEKLAE